MVDHLEEELPLTDHLKLELLYPDCCIIILIDFIYCFQNRSANTLHRVEDELGSANGKKAKEYMEKGQLVLDEIVGMMVKDRLSQSDSAEKGWLLDGYPRSSSQATTLQAFGFHPNLFILIEVPQELLVDRVVGRRLDPVTGRIYHLTYSPPETEEIAARLTQRFNDTEERVKLQLQTHNQNVESVLSMFEDITVKSLVLDELEFKKLFMVHSYLG
ncbi:unnamed protein product, partial [Lactuca virosa]